MTKSARHKGALKRNPVEWHHTIPVSENLEWHVLNLWNDGWTCVKPMKLEDHIRYHSKRSSKKSLKN